VKKILMAAILCGFSSLLWAEVNLNVLAQVDYKMVFNTNSADNNYNDFGFNQAFITISGDVAQNVKGVFAYDVAGTSFDIDDLGFMPGIWYAYADWKVFDTFTFSAGLMDSIFGYTIPSVNYARTVDLGVKVSQSFWDELLVCSIQAVRGDISFNDSFDGAAFTANTIRLIPAVQAELVLSPVKGFSIGAAARYSSYTVTNFIDETNTITFTNRETCAEGYLALTPDLIPGLTMTADIAMIMNSVIDGENFTGYYATADLNYAIGQFIPGIRVIQSEQSIKSAYPNNFNQAVAAYAKINVTEDGMFNITPYFQYNLKSLDAEDNSKPADIAFLRVRFELQFDLPLIKDEKKTEDK
jgi:hypothetical protein